LLDQPSHPEKPGGGVAQKRRAAEPSTVHSCSFDAFFYRQVSSNLRGRPGRRFTRHRALLSSTGVSDLHTFLRPVSGENERQIAGHETFVISLQAIRQI
jgi:hypothetical protein